MLNAIRNRHLMGLDLIFIPVAAYLSFALRLDGLDFGEYWPTWIIFAIAAGMIVPATMLLAGIYTRYWAYASVGELLRISAAVVVATMAITASVAIATYGLNWAPPVPRSIPVIFLLMGTVVVAIPRYAIRMAHQYDGKRATRRSRVLIVGSGDTGAMIARQLIQSAGTAVQPVGFVDDYFSRWTRIYDLPILGTVSDIPAVAATTAIDQAIIALPDASGKEIGKIVSLCESAGVKTRIMPSVQDLLDEKVHFSQIRDVQIEDLLRRDPIVTDISAVRGTISGKRVLVTGGGGSIGSELCRQLLQYLPSQLIILGHGENSIFEIQNELRQIVASGSDELNRVVIQPVIADIRFPQRLNQVFDQYRPDVIFHAAAHKHVPLMEGDPVEAISTNVMGTRYLLEAAARAGVERFVLISSDKAVNPTSIMGASKRVAELLVHAMAQRTGRPYMAVRFGNVLGSRGSVVQTFRKQIAAGQAITVTHPEMRRFFITIPEAVQLVLQASVLGAGGEIFMLDMGEPVKIVDLARTMIELSGLKPGRDIDIVMTGLRPGEKLYEELFVPGEEYAPTPHKQIFTAQSASRMPRGGLNQWIEALELAASRNDELAIFGVLRELIPEQKFSHSQAVEAAQIWSNLPGPERPKHVKKARLQDISAHSPSMT